MLDRGVMVAQGPAEVKEPAGAWVLVGDGADVAERLAEELAARNQTVVLAHEQGRGVAGADADGIVTAEVEPERRESVGGAAQVASRRRAVQRRRPPARAGRPRDTGNDARVHGGHEADGNERAGAGAGAAGRRRGAREGAVARHARRADARPRAAGRARGRDALGLREGGGPGGQASASADARPGGGGSAGRGRARGRAAAPRRRDAHRVPSRREADGAADAGRERDGAADAAGGIGMAALAKRGRRPGRDQRRPPALAGAGAEGDPRGGRGGGAELLGRVPRAGAHPGGAVRRRAVRAGDRGRRRGDERCRGQTASSGSPSAHSARRRSRGRRW